MKIKTIDDISTQEKIMWLREMEIKLKRNGYIPTIDEAVKELMAYENIHQDDEDEDNTDTSFPHEEKAFV